MLADPIVIIGGGHAAAQLCGALAAAGRGRGVQLICGEAELPYHRPPLSKAFLQAAAEAPAQWHRAEAWYADAGVMVRRGDPAVAIDRASCQVRLQSGELVPYGTLVLATGARARQLMHLPDGLANVALLRTLADAVRLRELLRACAHVTVVGGGFIGLEIAASARAVGKEVQVLQSAPRLLTRALSPEVAEHVLATHRANGVDVRLGVAVGGFEVEGDRLVSLSVDGVAQRVELMIQGIGAVPEHTLATDAGLACENGIVVDEHMVTSDPRVLAIGDCASFPHHATGHRMRLESVQNANDQARTAAATIIGQAKAHAAVPTFWSDQGSLRLQMAGIAPPEGRRYRRPGASENNFSMLHYVGDRLVCVESVNAPHDHLAARKLLDEGRTVAPELACDPAVPLKQR
jgi:3-phenylpropionate/trans-cinnamate dioxygenase ferredoxin reductase subunit